MRGNLFHVGLGLFQLCDAESQGKFLSKVYYRITIVAFSWSQVILHIAVDNNWARQQRPDHRPEGSTGVITSPCTCRMRSGLNGALSEDER